MKIHLLVITVFVSLTLSAQNIYRTQIFNPNIKTLQINPAGQQMGLPIIELNGSSVLTAAFDEMSHETHFYSYKVFHCDAGWMLSNLNTNEYLSGYTSENVTNYTTSINTTFLYTHYSFNLPNDEMGFKISGNYVLLIYEDNDVNKPVAQACFSVVEPQVNITNNVRGNTDTELNGRLQQLDFEVNLAGYTVHNPESEVKVIVRQNNRIDNQVTNISPTYISGSKLSYINNKALIFEGGNEYHRFDISSVYAAGLGVETIKFDRQNYNAYLFNDKIQPSKSYIHDSDVNGQFIVNMQNALDDNTEADYMYVHFSLPAKQPFFDGQLYLGGEFNYNLLNDDSRLKYDVNTGTYFQTFLLKQGGYNYQYWFVPKGETKASSERVDGSFWQTYNQYTIYVYHRPWGERYDKLIAVKVIE